MNCDFMKRWAALDASGDLGSEEHARLAAHLAECESCRSAAAGFAYLREQLAGMRDEALDPAVYAAVRERVLDQIEDRTHWMRWAAIAAALVLMTLAGWWMRSSRNVPVAIQPPPLRVAVPPAPAMVVPAVEHPRPIRPRHHRRASVHRDEQQPLVVKMLTNDPDVVIIWLVDGDKKGD